MPAWTQNSAGTWTMTGSTRSTVIAHDLAAGNFSVKLQLTDCTKGVGICVFSSQDGRSCFEVATNATNILIRRVTFGRVSASHSSPTDILVTAAHGLSAAVPFTLEARVTGSKITAHLNGNETATATFDNSTTQIYTTSGYIGFSGDTAGSQVLSFKKCSLRAVTRSRSDVLVAVGGNELWCAIEADRWFRVARVTIPADAESVAIIEWEQKALIVGGGKALVFDPSDLSIVSWAPTAGSLPGQTNAGTTTAVVGMAHMSRVWLSGMPEDPQNIYGSAIVDYLDFDTGANQYGQAFAFNTGRGKVGQPVRALHSDGARAVIGCDRSLWSMSGDPVFDNAILDSISLDTGVSGKDAIHHGTNGITYSHAPHGCCRIVGNSIDVFSRDLLSMYAEIPDDELDSYTVIVVRDPSRHIVHYYFTRKATVAEPHPASVHLCYDERAAVGGFGGFFPEVLPNRSGPTAACVWRGREVIFTRDGYCLEYDDDTRSDFDATAENEEAAITSGVALALIHSGSAMDDTLVERTMIVLGDDSYQMMYAVYGGVTAQEAFGEGGSRWLLGSGVLSSRTTPIIQRFRAGAIVLVLSQSMVGSTWSFERAEVVAKPCGASMRRVRSDGAIPPGPCTPPVPSGSGSGSGSGSFGSGPGSGLSGFSGGGSGGTSGSGGSPSGSLSGDGLPGDSGSGSSGGVDQDGPPNASGSGQSGTVDPPTGGAGGSQSGVGGGVVTP